MSYLTAGLGSALLDRLERVPRDGRWRTTREMCELMEYASPRSERLLPLLNSQHVERCDEHYLGPGEGVRWIWRRTDA